MLVMGHRGQRLMLIERNGLHLGGVPKCDVRNLGRARQSPDFGGTFVAPHQPQGVQQMDPEQLSLELPHSTAIRISTIGVASPACPLPDCCERDVHYAAADVA